MEIVDRLDRARAARDVLEHPFYQRWNAGELDEAELAVYAGEYRHAVVALAHASVLAADRAPADHVAGLRRHAREEAAHVEMWDEFARAAGRAPGVEGRAPLEQTRACAQAWTHGTSVLEHLAVLYVLEASQPEISRTKVAGLVAHYGYHPEGPATEYFRVHSELDREHANAARALIEELIERAPDPAAEADRMVHCAEAALEGNWLLLDGVQAAASAAPAR
jgi:pyrroloquinoline-quinone synthase